MNTTRRTNHTATIRRNRKSAVRYVLSIDGMSDFLRKEIIFKSGLVFLLENFEEDSEFYTLYSRDPQFWKWWIFEYETNETNFVTVFRTHGMSPNIYKYLDDARQFPHESKLGVSFEHNYLKILKNVNLSKVKRYGLQI
ncbi:MAG: hypothetical protein N4A41_00515 [Crocinitomicaceae bacterium]|jgi:hypothetical protein|nr:hypothetical protein [Crocinitomicaceae bacterium]